MLTAQQEEGLLRDALRTMMGQICKVGVSYSSELLIEGTIVVTIDRQKVIVIHFDDRLPPQMQLQTDAAATVAASSEVVPADSSRAETHELSMAPAASCAVSTSQLSTSSSRPGWYEGSSTSKMMNCLTELNDALGERVDIDLDSDGSSESPPSLAGIPFEDAAGCATERSTSMAAATRDFCSSSLSGSLRSSCGSGSQKKTFRRVKDAKNVIVIEDNELFDPAGGDMPEPFDDFGTAGELKSLASFARRSSLSLADCESVADDFSLETSGADDRKQFEPTTAAAALSCEMCGWHARTMSQLESHLVSLHGVVESQRLGRRIAHFACPLCGKRYRFRAQLDKHRLQHGAGAGERPHRCRSCRNTYRHAQSLALHACVHGKGAAQCGARLHCPACDKTYANKVLFQKHIVYMHERMSCSDEVLPQDGF